MMYGTIIVNTTSVIPLILHFWTNGIYKFDDYELDPQVTMANFGSTQFAQNAIIAYPMN